MTWPQTVKIEFLFYFTLFFFFRCSFPSSYILTHAHDEVDLVRTSEEVLKTKRKILLLLNGAFHGRSLPPQQSHVTLFLPYQVTGSSQPAAVLIKRPDSTETRRYSLIYHKPNQRDSHFLKVDQGKNISLSYIDIYFEFRLVRIGRS